MQALTAPPRENLTGDQVRALITGPAIEIDATCELVTIDINGLFTIVGDLSEQLQPAGSSITWDANTGDDGSANVNRSCNIQLSQLLSWGTDLIRLGMTLANNGITAKFYLGVYCLTSPDQPVGTDPITYTVSGYDRLYLLQRQVGDSYEATAGTAILQAVANVISAAGLGGINIDQSGSALTLATDMVWPLIPTDSGNTATYLDIANRLLAAANYDPLWCDENGIYRSQPHLDPTERVSEFTLDVDDPTTTIVGAIRTFTQDLWAAPNKWIFLQSDFDGTPTDGDGLYIVINDSNGPASITGRDGLIVPQQVTVDAADQTTLEAIGDSIVTAALANNATLPSYPTGCLPLAGQDDLMTVIDRAAGGTSRVTATSWSLPLDGSDMTWDLEVVG